MNTDKARLPLALVGGSLLLGILACRIFTSPSTATPQAPAGIDALRFTNERTGTDFRELDRFIRNQFSTHWNTTNYQLIGNFHQSSWCRGKGSRPDCLTNSTDSDNRDQQLVTLYTLFYPQDYPQVFGLGFQALRVPRSTGWGASFYYAEDGKTIVGEGWGVEFRQYRQDMGPADATFRIGWDYAYTIEGPKPTTFEQKSELPLREDLARYLQGAAAMRDLALENMQKLEDKVVEALENHEVQGCDLGPYQNNGIPPVCTPRPLTAAEEAAELDKARAYFKSQNELARLHAEEMYQSWLEAFPVDQFWR